ncbi:MAG: hypothetical protein AAF944_19440 [Bacteroidota bacterium]
MIEKKIVIHIGLPKTASTYLQTTYFPHLKKVTYIGRPYTQINKAFNSLQWIDDPLFSLTEFQNEIEHIKKYHQENNTILISDELFFGNVFYNFMNRGIIARRLSLAIPNAEIILFIRNQNDLILSLYNQFVKIGLFNDQLNRNFIHKSGEDFTLETWFADMRKWCINNNRYISHRSLFNINHLRYSAIIKLYKDLFNKVHVFLYEDLVNNKAMCLNRISLVLNTENPKHTNLLLEKTKNVNKGLTKKELQIQLMKNQLNVLFSKKSLISRLTVKVLSGVLYLSFNGLEESNKQYLLYLLKEEKIYEDNVYANNKWSLGMENYAKKYFGDITRTS